MLYVIEQKHILLIIAKWITNDTDIYKYLKIRLMESMYLPCQAPEIRMVAYRAQRYSKDGTLDTTSQNAFSWRKHTFWLTF